MVTFLLLQMDLLKDDIWNDLAHHLLKSNSKKKTVKFKTYLNSSYFTICLEFSSGCSQDWHHESLCLFSRSLEEDIPLMSWRNFVTDNFFLTLQMQNPSIVSGVPGPGGHPVVSPAVGAERRVEKGALPRLPVGTGHPVVWRMPNRPFYAHELRNAQKNRQLRKVSLSWPFFIGKTGSWDVSIGDFY